jgi:hypothetical protein
MGKAKKLYVEFQKALEVAEKSAASGDLVQAYEDAAIMCYHAGKCVGFDDGITAAFWAMVKGGVAGIVLGGIVSHFIAKAIEEEGGPVKYGPFTFSKKED